MVRFRKQTPSVTVVAVVFVATLAAALSFSVRV
jgi:hypothetical protein